MTTTERDTTALAYLAGRLREDTPGVRPWDRAGIEAVTAKWVGRELRSCVERLRHASDREARTPEVMNRPWIPDPLGPGPVMPPKPEEACQECQRHVARCICDSAPQARPRTRSEAREERAAELRREKAQAAIEGVGKRAPLCSHGVPRTHCVDHRPAATEGETQ